MHCHVNKCSYIGLVATVYSFEKINIETSALLANVIECAVSIV